MSSSFPILVDKREIRVAGTNWGRTRHLGQQELLHFGQFLCQFLLRAAAFEYVGLANVAPLAGLNADLREFVRNTAILGLRHMVRILPLFGGAGRGPGSVIVFNVSSTVMAGEAQSISVADVPVGARSENFKLARYNPGFHQLSARATVTAGTVDGCWHFHGVRVKYIGPRLSLIGICLEGRVERFIGQATLQTYARMAWLATTPDARIGQGLAGFSMAGSGPFRKNNM